jgi:hypothetical protein
MPILKDRQYLYTPQVLPTACLLTKNINIGVNREAEYIMILGIVWNNSLAFGNNNCNKIIASMSIIERIVNNYTNKWKKYVKKAV